MKVGNANNQARPTPGLVYQKYLNFSQLNTLQSTETIANTSMQLYGKVGSSEELSSSSIMVGNASNQARPVVAAWVGNANNQARPLVIPTSTLAEKRRITDNSAPNNYTRSSIVNLNTVYGVAPSLPRVFPKECGYSFPRDSSLTQDRASIQARVRFSLLSPVAVTSSLSSYTGVTTVLQINLYGIIGTGEQMLVNALILLGYHNQYVAYIYSSQSEWSDWHDLSNFSTTVSSQQRAVAPWNSPASGLLVVYGPYITQSLVPAEIQFEEQYRINPSGI